MRTVPGAASLAPTLALVLGVVVQQPAVWAQGYVALMAGQSARPLNGRFNNVPVLHSNQPEEVEGAGILINTAPGFSYTSEGNQALRNAEFSFNGAFGMHIHHKYIPADRSSISSSQRRDELTLAAILINPGVRPVHVRFETGAVRNSFEAPYLANNLMGVKPLGPRPWNTGPGDATAVQMLRGKLDNRLTNEITIPARSRLVLFQTQLPALGIANALLKGTSDGPFQIAVVAAKDPQSDGDILAVLDSQRLAPGRVYLNRVDDIHARRVFSRVGGVALGDTYQASIQHDLQTQGPLHVPFTSTDRVHFGTNDVQVNPLAIRMLDSALDNVGTYGVRFTIDLNLRGDGPYELVMSHPSPTGGRNFTAFRGSIQIQTPGELREVHVGLRSGQSLSLGQIQLRPGQNNPVRVTMVYPADATPGHLLSVVPLTQLALLQDRERMLELARLNSSRPAAPTSAPPSPITGTPPLPPLVAPVSRPSPQPLRPSPQPLRPSWLVPPPAPPSRLRRPRPTPSTPTGSSSSLIDRYQQAVDAQWDVLMRGSQMR